jgi:GNAT superfamily N-acetyltransferase
MAEFDDKFLRKIEKDLTQNDIKATVQLFVDNPQQPEVIRLRIEWKLEDQWVGTGVAILNTQNGIGFFPHLVFDERFQGKGLYTTFVNHAIREWPKRGITKVQAAYLDPLSKIILQTGGFEEPTTPVDGFSLDLKGQRAKELKAWTNGDEEPEWRVEAKQEAAAIQRVNDSQE